MLSPGGSQELNAGGCRRTKPGGLAPSLSPSWALAHGHPGVAPLLLEPGSRQHQVGTILPFPPEPLRHPKAATGTSGSQQPAARTKEMGPWGGGHSVTKVLTLQVMETTDALELVEHREDGAALIHQIPSGLHLWSPVSQPGSHYRALGPSLSPASTKMESESSAPVASASPFAASSLSPKISISSPKIRFSQQKLGVLT